MKIKDERVVETVPFGMIDDGEMFYYDNHLYLKIPLCYEHKPKNYVQIFDLADRRNCVEYVARSFGLLAFCKEDAMVVPVSAMVTIAEPGCIDGF